ncbi:site-specific integrase [Pseudomonas sp. A-R-26]|uniref:site-specific integrase n=1 Tax=Pseudomonas sp. A-R-26 TaxID=2832404 RepID=UPI001CC03A4C|nr:site-specific integrase [Pseudomonas sp. A-R-26]
MSTIPPNQEEKYSFPTARFGKRQTPWNLLPLLYKNGAGANVRTVIDRIKAGLFGNLLSHRVPLVDAIHEHINHYLISGRSQFTAKLKVRLVRNFFSWCEKEDRELTIDSLENDFISWSAFQLGRNRAGDVQLTTSSGVVSSLSAIFDEILNLRAGLHSKTQIHYPRSKRNNDNSNYSKQNLEDAYSFGHFLYDITTGLSVDAIRGTLPVIIPLRMGGELVEWSRLRPASIVKRLNAPEVSPHHKRETEKTRAAYIADTSLRTRHPLVNLRLEAELLIFIAETGMTLSTAYLLPYSKHSYRSIIGGYELSRVFKDRAEKEVLGEIHSEYRLVFEDYLKWRNEMFPNEEDGLLFPLRSAMGRATHEAPSFAAVKKRCERLATPFIGARNLRKLKVNFFLRETKDPDLTAEMAQHTIETLFRNYNKPNHQIALIEITRFYNFHDPSLTPPGPGVCVKAEPIPAIESDALIPIADCLSSSGCLFCLQQRDIESEDYVWSLITFRHLKTIELSRNDTAPLDSKQHPAYLTILRITSKINFFAQHIIHGKDWIIRSEKKIEEGNYHPKWDGFIRLNEYSK